MFTFTLTHKILYKCLRNSKWKAKDQISSQQTQGKDVQGFQEEMSQAKGQL